MRLIVQAAAFASMLIQTGCATAGGQTGVVGPSEAGRILFEGAFDPDRNFAGDLRTNSDEELVLTAAARNRDDYAPAYSLAVAHQCLPIGKSSERRCGYTARILRVGPPGDGGFDRSLRLLARVRSASDIAAMRPLLDDVGLQWLEADVDACPSGIFAMDSVRTANWNPGIHHALQPMDEREIILHPATIRVQMTGSYTTSRYQGWVLADGVPTAIRRLLDTLEPCWRPSMSPRPWNR